MYMFGEDLWDDLLRMPATRQSEDWSQKLMKTDIRQVGENIHLEVELPGYDRKGIRVHLKEGVLTIEASREQAEEAKYVRRERFLGSCKRSFLVGRDLREEDIRARYESGILTITFSARPKRAQDEKRTIQIEG